MTVIPAIDLLAGACVRLHQGSYESARRYAADPVRTALGFARAGARWIHVVDLDAARGRAGANRAVIFRIAQALARAGGCRLEVGGGIRAEEDLAELARAGASRLVLGTVLAREPRRVAEWVQAGPAGAEKPAELWAGIDALDGKVRVGGWGEEAGIEDLELARRARELGLAGIVYTSIARDGTLGGPDIERTNRVAEASGLPVILSGGIGSEQDVERVFRLAFAGVTGLIVGKAIYEGRLDLERLLRRFSGKPRDLSAGGPSEAPSGG
jgi:phosphoribosylformimino-5-aminoimidazole carboxamide ribotide isomerase